MELTVILLPQPPGHCDYKCKPASASALSTLMGSKGTFPSSVSLGYKFWVWEVGLGGTFSGDPMETQHRPPPPASWASVSCAIEKGGPSALLMVTEGNVSPLSLLYLHSWLPDPGVIRGPFLEIRCSAPEWDSGKNTHAPPPLLHTHLPHLSVSAELGKG